MLSAPAFDDFLELDLSAGDVYYVKCIAIPVLFGVPLLKVLDAKEGERELNKVKRKEVVRF